MASMMAVTDTHSLLWYANLRTHNKLGRDALLHFQRVDRREAAVYVPALVLAEVGELAHLGRINLGLPFSDWMDGVLSNACILSQPLTHEIVRTAHNLFAIPERGDRLIAATAVALDVPLITRDPEIAACANVTLLW
jgi:PIN domain nuclease of toxin-antitoxin system